MSGEQPPSTTATDQHGNVRGDTQVYGHGVPGPAPPQRPPLVMVNGYVCEVGDGEPIRVLSVAELERLGFKHDDDAELQRRALRAVQRYAQHLPPGVRDVIREALGQTRPEWNRPVLRAELVDAALTWAAASGVAPIDEATTRLEQLAERYRLATTVDHEQVPGG